MPRVDGTRDRDLAERDRALDDGRRRDEARAIEEGRASEGVRVREDDRATEGDRAMRCLVSTR